MTATWYERVDDSRGAEGSGLFGNAFARGSTTRVFLVTGYPRDQIIQNPTSIVGGTTGDEPLPGYNSGHPSQPSMILRRYNVAPEGIHHVAVAYYDNTMQFRLPARIDKLAPGYKSPSGSIASDLDIEIPIAVRTTYDVSNGEQTATIKVWAERKVLIQHTHETVSHRVNLSEFTEAHREAIHAQSGHLHKLGQTIPRWFRFLGASYFEAEPGLWAVDYSWAHDPGTLSLPTQSEPGLVIIPPNWNYFDGNDWVRPPFHEIKYVQHEDGPAYPPRFALVLKYVRDDFGHETLPGY